MKHTIDQYIRAASELINECAGGELEIDLRRSVIEGQDGGYVEALIYVPDSRIEEQP